MAESLVLLAEAGIRAGDDSVAEDYAAWVRGLPEKAFSDDRISLFLPVWRHPGNSKLAELARWAFLSEDSVWRPHHEGSRRWRGEWTSPLLAVPAFRRMLKRELADTTVVGTINIDFSNSMSIEWKGGGRSLYNCPVYMPDADVPRSLYVPLLQCDACAWELSELDGAPRFKFYWSEKQRTATRAEMAKFFDRWGGAFREENPVREVYEFPFSQPKFRLARLGNPATAEDVAAGRAVFSLRDSGQVRVVAVKPFPSNARWKTLKEFRLREPVPIFPPQSPVDLSVERINASSRESFDREGRIWQAEEVLIQGRWKRFYGFVGNHIIAKVPAEDIELLEDFEVHINSR